MKRNLSTTIQRTAPQSPACTGGIRGGLIRTALAALLIATAAACSDKEDFGDGNTPDLVTVRFSSVPEGEQTSGTAQSPSCQGGVRDGSPETRTTIRPDGKTVWWNASTDNIGIFAVPAPSVTDGTTVKNKHYAPATDGETAQFRPVSEPASQPAEEMQLTPGTYTFYSYYPWEQYGYNTGKTTMEFILGDFDQNGGNNTGHIGEFDFMWAKTTATVSNSGDPVNVEFTYSHALPMLRIRNGLNGKTITGICVRSETDAMRGYSDISLTDGKVTPRNSTTRKIFLKITDGLAVGDTASLLIFPQTREGGELIIGAMTDDGTIYELKKRLPSGGLTGGKAYRINFNINQQSDGEVYITYNKPDGNGTTGSPYEISDEAGLRWLAMAVSYFRVTPASAKLTPAKTTIDLHNSNWEPIGDVNYPYTGTFDGNGGTVTNLKVDYFNEPAGFFGVVENGSVSNLRVEGSVTAAGQSNVGGIAGYTRKNSPIINCVFKGRVKGSTSIGSIAGINYGRISDCYATGNVEATDSVAGGISGKCMDSKGTIEDCYSSANVIAWQHAGGIVGYNSGGAATTCYATGTVEATGQHAGGIVGTNLSGTITNCIALNTAIVRTAGSLGTTFGRVAGVNNTAKGAEIKTCAAWDGMTVMGNTITIGDGAATIHGTPLTALQCVTSTTYTGTPYNFAPDKWDFEGGTFTMYLPWNKVLFGYWSDVVKAEIPLAIKNAAAGNTQP